MLLRRWWLVSTSSAVLEVVINLELVMSLKLRQTKENSDGGILVVVVIIKSEKMPVTKTRGTRNYLLVFRDDDAHFFTASSFSSVNK